MPDNEAGVHIAPHLAGEGGGTDKETLESQQPDGILLAVQWQRESDAAANGALAEP